MAAKRTSPWTDAILDGVKRYMDKIQELVDDPIPGFLEIKVDQRELKKRFLTVARSVPYDFAGEQAFIQEFGQDQWDYQHELDMRQSNE